MKKILNLFVFCMVLFIGCSEEGKMDVIDEVENSMERGLSTKSGSFEQMSWRQQLAYGIDSIPSILVENGIRFLGYSEKYVLHTQEQIVELKKTLLSERAYFPLVLDNGRKYIFLNRSDIENNSEYKKMYNFQGLAEELDTLLKIENRVLSLVWEYKGTSISTLCIVDDHTGFIYDNIISNLIVIEERKIEHKGEMYGVNYSVKRLKVRSGESGDGGDGGDGGGAIGGGGGFIGGGDIGGGDIGGGQQWNSQPVYKVDSREKIMRSALGNPLGSVIFEHVAKGIGRNGIVEMTSSEMEGHVQVAGSGEFDFRYVEKRMGTDGISYARTAYYLSTKGIKLKIIWENSYAKIEGQFDSKYTATGIAESTLRAREGGWLMGYY